MRFFNLFTPAHTEIVNKKPADAAPCGRSERPQNRADTTPCLSDVYNIGTRAKKRTANTILSGRSFFHRVLQIRRDFLTTCTQKSTRGKKSQADVALCGRSMVEMLGVLAIIGVLSVGAIAGYSKAMMKYKLNKQVEQIGSILDYVEIHADMWQKERTNISSPIFLLHKLGIIPLEMIQPNNYSAAYDVFNKKVRMQHHLPNETNAADYFELIHYYEGDLDICLNLFQMAKLRSSFLDSIVICGGGFECQGYNGDNPRFSSASPYLKDVTLEDMHNLCQTAPTDSYLAFRWAVQWGSN